MTTSQIVNNDTLHIKLQFNDEYRRFNVPRLCKYAELIEKIKSLLTLNKDLTLKYKDDENEWITISSDIELETGIGFCKSNLLRLLISIKKSSVDSECGLSDEEDGMPLWKKRRMMRLKKRMEECGDEEGDCGQKWGKWRKWRRGCSDEEDGDCGKWKKWRKHRDECGEEQKKCPRGRRWRKGCGDEEDGDCGKWKKWRKNREEEEEVESGKERRRRGRRSEWTESEREEWLAKKRERKEKRLAKKNEQDVDTLSEKESEKDTTSVVEGDLNSGDELLSLEQIKKEIEALKGSVQKLKEKTNGAKEGLVALQNEIKEKRKAGSFEEVLTLRGKLKTLKEEKFTLFTEVKKNQRRIRALSKLASNKGK